MFNKVGLDAKYGKFVTTFQEAMPKVKLHTAFCNDFCTLSRMVAIARCVRLGNLQLVLCDEQN